MIFQRLNFLPPIHQKWRGEDRKQMHWTAVTDREKLSTLQTEASMILNCMACEHAVYVGVLKILYPLMVRFRYTTLLTPQYASPERASQTYSSNKVWMLLHITLHKHWSPLPEVLHSLQTQFCCLDVLTFCCCCCFLLFVCVLFHWFWFCLFLFKKKKEERKARRNRQGPRLLSVACQF